MASLTRSQSVCSESEYLQKIRTALVEPTDKSIAKAERIFQRAIQEGAFLGQLSCSYQSYLTAYDEAREMIEKAKRTLPQPVLAQSNPLTFEKVEV